MAPFERPSLEVAKDILDCWHAPVVGSYFLGATIFGLVILQKPQLLPKKRHRIASASIIFTLVAYLAEVLYYLIHSLNDNSYDTPHNAVTNCLGSILILGPLSITLARAREVQWHPYFGAFVLEFVFGVTFCLLHISAVAPERRQSNVPILLASLRALSSTLLVIDWFLIHTGKLGRKSTDEESQSLLGDQPNGISTAKAMVDYGSTKVTEQEQQNDETSDDDDEYDSTKIKGLQAKRVEQAGGVIGYFRSFAIFLPYIWPKDDPKILFCLFVRVLYMLMVRVFNVLGPRQLGILTDKLASGTTVMPWRDIGLWTLFAWITGSSGFGLLDSIAQEIIRNRSEARITLMTYEHVLNLSMDFHTNKSSGETTKAIDQGSSINRLLDTMIFDTFPIFFDVFISIWYVTHLFDTYMAYIILFMGAIYVWCEFQSTAWNADRRRLYIERCRNESGVVDETMHNWQTVFYFNREKHEHKRYSDAVFSSMAAYYRYVFAILGCGAAKDVLMTAGFTGCCILAIHQIVSGKTPVGHLVTFIMYWETMMGPLRTVAYSWRSLNLCLIDAERLKELLLTKPTVNDADDAQPLVVTAGKVEFKGVDFGYDSRKQILHDINFKAEGGQTVALVGETGGGKSTMLQLLIRGFDVTGGFISIDDQDIRSVTRSSLGEIIGIVPQEPALFNASIRENIRYGRLNATDAEIEDACRAAAIHSAIIDFPDGYNSKVGERGVKLSGGQKQRIAIARVLLRNPKIVLLDEATSAVDSATEAHIQEAFKMLSAGRTTFMIAHRLSTIVEADQILVVDKGVVIERGSHKELLRVGGKYKELWNQQTKTPGGSSGGSTVGETGSGMLINVTSAGEPEASADGAGLRKR